LHGLLPERLRNLALDIRRSQADIAEHSVIEARQGDSLPTALTPDGNSFREANEHSGNGQPLAGGRSEAAML
jgi:hypothetical protein